FRAFRGVRLTHINVQRVDTIARKRLFRQSAIILPLYVEMRCHITDANVIGPPLISHNLSLFDRLTDFKIIERVFIQMPVDDLIMLPSGIVKREDERPAKGIPSGTRRYFSIGNGRYAGIVVLAEVVCTVITAAIAIRIDAVTHEISFPPRFSLAVRVGFPIFIRVGYYSESFILQIFNRIMLLRHRRHLLRSVLHRSVQWDRSL